MKDKKKIILVSIVAAIVVVLVGVLTVRILQSKLVAEKKTGEVKKNPVSVVEAHTGSISETLFYTGDLHAEKEAFAVPALYIITEDLKGRLKAAQGGAR